MRVTTHGEYLIQLTRLTAFNSFLVREADGFTAVDTGLPGSAKGILETASKHGAPILRILLTHAHMDHVASLDALHKLLPNAEVMISERDARFLRGDRSLDPSEPQTKPRGSFKTCTTQPTRLLNTGDRIGSLEVIATPGHTPGHISFFDHRDGTLIAGDAFSTKGGISVSGTVRLLFPFPAIATWHKPTAIASAERSCEFDAKRLAVGHGDILENPLHTMRQAIAEAKKHVG
jgi:glyoxylase-like metal-dependent hydrolase (beta-lactamase superfamily II)